MLKKTLYINEDNAHFYIGHPEEDMSVKGLNNLVDTYAKSNHLGGILFNINVQRALFDSQAWEPLYSGYDQEGGPNQPCLQWLAPEQRKLRPGCHGRTWVHNLWLLKDRGIDHFAVWLERCRHHGVEGWLSIRMNDCHHNDNEDAFWHPTLWKEKPELRRIPYRDEGWFEGAFDFSFPEVVKHHMKLIREACSRWDMDGIELDWARWVRHFRPGSEEKNAHILTQIMCDTSKLVKAAASRLGHPVKLGVRLPADLTNAVTLGYDIPEWSKQKLVDVVTLAPFFNQPFYDWQVALWRSVLGDGVKVLCQPEHFGHASPVAEDGGIVQDYRLHFGSCAAALERGADGIYLFNDCYREGPVDKVRKAQPDILENLLNVAPDIEKLRDFPRRQMLSFPQICGPGMPTGSVLPIALTKPELAYDFGRFRDTITLRIPLGPKPDKAKATLVLGFDEATKLDRDPCSLWLNGQALNTDENPAVIAEWEAKKTWGKNPVFLPNIVKQVLTWQIPNEILQSDTNIIEFLPPKVLGNLVWTEIKIDA